MDFSKSDFVRFLILMLTGLILTIIGGVLLGIITIFPSISIISVGDIEYLLLIFIVIGGIVFLAISIVIVAGKEVHDLIILFLLIFGVILFILFIISILGG